MLLTIMACCRLPGICTRYTSDITITQTMNFGWFMPSSTLAGTIQITNTGTVVPSAGITVVSSHQPIPEIFTLHRSASGNVTVYIISSSSPPTLTLNGPSSSTMTVDNWDLSIATGSNPNRYTVNYAWTSDKVVTLGATLHVKANQTPGTYTGNFTIYTVPN